MTDEKTTASLRTTSVSSATRVRFEAYTDWLVVIAATVLTALDKFEPEWCMGLFVLVAGLTGMIKKRGVNGGTATGVIFLLAKKVIALTGLGAIVFLLGGCGWFTSSQVATATAAGIAQAAELIKEQTGKNLDELPTECDLESLPDAKPHPQVLMLCTITITPDA